MIPAGGQEAIPNREDGVGYWPMSLAVSVEGRTSVVRVFAERVRGTESRFGFVNLGPTVATFVVPSGGAPRLRSVVDLGPDDPWRRNVGWGAAVALAHRVPGVAVLDDREGLRDAVFGADDLDRAGSLGGPAVPCPVLP